jgi:predicted nucleic acid-binding protein
VAAYYLDTSALAKLYIREPGTDFLLRLAAEPPGGQLVILELAQVELHSAVRLRSRLGHLASEEADDLLERFDGHAADLFIVQPVNAALMQLACELLARHPLRAYGSLQLAGCLATWNTLGTHPPTFVCSDAALLAAAGAEGLPVADPVAG